MSQLYAPLALYSNTFRLLLLLGEYVSIESNPIDTVYVV